MRPFRSLADATTVDELVQRLERFTATSQRQWGTMTSHEMLCHLGDAFDTCMGHRPASRADNLMSRTLIKWIALGTSMPWPQGVPTMPEVNPKQRGTKPDDFERDRRRVLDLLHRFVQPDATCVAHPFFGPMTRSEWLRWGYGHVDHHLRQFSC